MPDTETTFAQVENPVVFRGTHDNCSYCGKKFGPNYVVTRINVHYIFRVRTKYATYYGPTHGPCVDTLARKQLPGTEESR